MVMAVNGFECLLNDPTRITADTATCIDHVFTRVSRVDMMSVEADVEHAGITDHSLVRVCVGVCEARDGGGGPASPAPAQAYRTDYDKLNRLLVCADWADVYRQSDASSAFDCFFHTFEKGKISTAIESTLAERGRFYRRHRKQETSVKALSHWNLRHQWTSMDMSIQIPCGQICFSGMYYSLTYIVIVAPVIIICASVHLGVPVNAPR
ncbi:hypothetical protein J6590_105589, partial [Homalodisca vitripennis]